MAGIAGIARRGAGKEVSEMLDIINHRGNAGRSVFESGGTTLGIIWSQAEESIVKEHLVHNRIADDNGPGHCARAEGDGDSLLLYRDELGVAPLYYGSDDRGSTCFASEVKALLPLTLEVKEMPPGTTLDAAGFSPHFLLRAADEVDDVPERIAARLRMYLEDAVAACIKSDDIGSWLSGGLDSSAICALAAGHVGKLKTFAAGITGAPDLEYAKEVARHIGSEHHEVTVTTREMIKTLPEVIFHLESFDALLVRSSITNFLVAKRASDYVSEVFSGEGGDELFAGYEYLKSIASGALAAELVKITGSLHNTALQRVDRSSSAHGTVAHTVFTNPEVVSFALEIPVKYKIKDGIEKWILRKAMERDLPEPVLRRPKAKFWEGAGVQELISDYADSKISANSFQNESRLENGWLLNSREELLYYRIFCDHFGKDIDLSWMGRTGVSSVS